MATHFTVGNRIFAVKEESTAGTFETPVASDYNIVGFDVEALNFEKNGTRLGKPASGNLNQTRTRSGKITGSTTIKTALHHSGDESVKPNIDKLLKASGLTQDATVLGNIRYTYDGTQPCSTLSLVVTELNCGSAPSGVTAKGRGCVPALTIEAPGVGEQFALSFEMSAAYEGEEDVASPIKALTGVDDDVYTEKLLNSVFTIGGQAFVMHNATLSLNPTISPVDDPDKPGGVLFYRITGFDPVLTASVQMLDLETSDLPDNVIDDVIISSITIAGKYYDFEIIDGNIRNAPKGEAEGIVTNELEIEVRKFTMTQKDIVAATS